MSAELRARVGHVWRRDDWWRDRVCHPVWFRLVSWYWGPFHKKDAETDSRMQRRLYLGHHASLCFARQASVRNRVRTRFVATRETTADSELPCRARSGMAYIGMGIAALVGSPIAGQLLERTPNFVAPICFSGARKRFQTHPLGYVPDTFLYDDVRSCDGRRNGLLHSGTIRVRKGKRTLAGLKRDGMWTSFFFPTILLHERVHLMVRLGFMALITGCEL